MFLMVHAFAMPAIACFSTSDAFSCGGRIFSKWWLTKFSDVVAFAFSIVEIRMEISCFFGLALFP